MLLCLAVRVVVLFLLSLPLTKLLLISSLIDPELPRLISAGQSEQEVISKTFFFCQAMCVLSATV